MSDEIYTQYEFDNIVENVELELSDPDGWDRLVSKNKSFFRRDTYGSLINEFAERWMKGMQYAVEEDGYELAEVARPLSWLAGAGDISGHQYEAAMDTIGEYWAYSEEFNDWRRNYYSSWNG